eukprot:932878_1
MTSVVFYLELISTQGLICSQTLVKIHDPKAIIAQRNAMIMDMYDGKSVNGKEFDGACENSVNTRPSYSRKANSDEDFEEDLVREQTSQSRGFDNSEAGCSSAISSGEMRGGDSASRSSFDISYGVTTTGNSRGRSSCDISSGATTPKGNSRGFSSAANLI